MINAEARPLHIVLVSAEAYPWLKVGGLGDVVGALGRYLTHAGHRVTLFIPYLRSDTHEAPAIATRTLPQPGRPDTSLNVTIHRILDDPLFKVYGFRIPGWIDRPPLYSPDRIPDDFDRFTLFSLAVLTFGPLYANHVDILHLHDWHTCPLIVFLRSLKNKIHPWQHRPTVLTIHNLAYQGTVPLERINRFFIKENAIPSALIHRGHLNLLKAGIVHATCVTTVSPTYAREIQTPEKGEGLDDVLRNRTSPPIGILNGIDTDVWNPATDPHLPANYLAHRLDGKGVCRQFLFQRFRLNLTTELPLVGVIARLTYQKGIDLIAESLPHLLQNNRIRLIVLGTGEPSLEQTLRDMAAAHPNRMAFHAAYDEALAHQIEAGADIFLMPSRFEPCGLNQMYSLRYGTVPCVADTGGLVDTVPDFRHDPDGGTGIRFRTDSAHHLLTNLNELAGFYRYPDLWHTLMRRGMGQDFSWKTTIHRYIDLYSKLRSEVT